MKKYIRVLKTGLFALTFAAASSEAAELSNVKFPDQIEISGQTLVLNGLGIRNYLFASVYVAGLYGLKKSQSEDEILDRVGDAKEEVVVRMHFKRGVAEADMRDAWRHYLEKNSTGSWVELKPIAEAYLLAIPAVKPGDILTHTFSPGKMTVNLNGADLQSFNSRVLAKTVLATWIGKYPTTESMKHGLLGKK